MSVDDEWVICRAQTSDFESIVRLLAAAQLPTDDLATALGLQLWALAEHDALVGAIGLERRGTGGLLRSLVIAPSHQRRGLGVRLVRAVERESRFAGVELLVLLTETAEPFFHRLGYQVVDRQVVPDELKHSAEFQSLCPASAVCMNKSLTH